jgi:hypothetical protein
MEHLKVVVAMKGKKKTPKLVIGATHMRARARAIRPGTAVLSALRDVNGLS